MALLRRKSGSDPGEEAELESAQPAVEDARKGPWDIADAQHLVTGEGPAEGVVDLGSLVVPMREGFDLRLQVDENSGEVLAALVVGEDGMLELRAFAAARNDDLWEEVRRDIAAETAQRGGTADDRTGPLGQELYCEVPVQMEDGTAGIQPSRILGCNGPRWFLRGALLGRPAMEPATAGPWEEMFASIAVRRGEGAMPPGEALPIQLPPDAQRVG